MSSPNEPIGHYSGPYERWMFSKELGFPFAFPALHENFNFVAALCKADEKVQLSEIENIRLPPLWPAQETKRSVTPFAFSNLTKDSTAELAVEAQIDQALQHKFSGSDLNNAQQKSYYQVNCPIDADTWVAEEKYCLQDNMRGWQSPGVTPKAIVAVIDDGIPFGNRAFLNEKGDQTRVSHCWLQSARVSDEQTAVPFGREYLNGEINSIRTSAGDDDVLFYRMAGAVDRDLPELGTNLRNSNTHGAHVMGMCAGNSSVFTDVLDDSVQIIAVQLPNTVAWDTSGFGKEMYMLSALHYVFNRAEAIATAITAKGGKIKELPLIINFSYGWNADRHDGESEMEMAIQELLEQRKLKQPQTALIMPTGNTFEGKMHAQISELNFSAKVNHFSIGWQLQPDDRTPSYLEIWFPKGVDPSNYRVKVISPVGQVIATEGEIQVTADSKYDGDNGNQRRFTELKIAGLNVGQLSADFHNGNRWRVLCALIPTNYIGAEKRRAPAGLWTIKIERNDKAQVLAEDQFIDIWVQRGDDPVSLGTAGRQSYLVELASSPEHGDSQDKQQDELKLITGYGSMNGVASSKSTTRVGGYVRNTGRPSSYSSCGGVYIDESGHSKGAKLREEHRQIDFMAVADQTNQQLGTPSIGVLSGSRSHLTGTSGAAPSVTRLAAINAVEGRDLFTDLNQPEPHGKKGNGSREDIDYKKEAREKPSSRVRAVTRI